MIRLTMKMMKMIVNMVIVSSSGVHYSGGLPVFYMGIGMIRPSATCWGGVLILLLRSVPLPTIHTCLEIDEFTVYDILH